MKHAVPTVPTKSCEIHNYKKVKKPVYRKLKICSCPPVSPILKVEKNILYVSVIKQYIFLSLLMISDIFRSKGRLIKFRYSEKTTKFRFFLTLQSNVIL